MPQSKNPRSKPNSKGNTPKQQKKKLTNSSHGRPNRPRVPFRTTPNQWNKDSYGDVLLRQNGGRGTDILSDSHRVSSPAAEPPVNLVGIMDVTPAVSKRSVVYLSLGIVLRALRLGLMATNSGKDATPYYAFRYLIDAFTLAVQGGTTIIQAAPRWFWEIYYALKSKTVPFKTGQVNFAGSVIDLEGLTLGTSLPMGTGALDFAYFWGYASSTAKVNGYFVLTPPSTPYDQQTNGVASFQYLWSAFQKGGGLNDLIQDPGTDGAILGKDTSAYACVSAEYGTSWWSPNGLSVNLNHECPIDTPMLAKFCTYNDEDQEFEWRGYQKFHKGGGSSAYIGPRMSELTAAYEARNKVSPIFKTYNLHEFIERLALIVGYGIESFVQQNPTLEPPHLNINFQDFCILVRQSILPYFDNDLAPDLRLEGGAFVSMVPVTVGCNGVSQTALSNTPLFPLFFAENVRACGRIRSHLKNKVKDGKAVLDIVPLLCVPPTMTLPQNYVYGVESVAIFQGDTTGQVAISLLDCSATTGQSTSYLDLNGPVLSRVINEWNRFMSSMSTCFSSLVPLGGEKGISLLNCNVYTLRSQYTPTVTVQSAPTPISSKNKEGQVVVTTLAKGSNIATPPLARQVSTKKIEYGLIRPKHTFGTPAPFPEGTSYFETTMCKAYYLNQAVPGAVWKYRSRMVCPTSLVTSESLGASDNLYQSLHCEPFSIPCNNFTTKFQLDDAADGDAESMFQRSISAAMLDVKNPQASSQNEIESELEQLGKAGRGGFFTNLAAQIGNAIGIPEIGMVAKAVGKVIDV